MNRRMFWSMNTANHAPTSPRPAGKHKIQVNRGLTTPILMKEVSATYLVSPAPLREPEIIT